MKHPHFLFVLLFFLVLPFLWLTAQEINSAPQYSELWGVNGELWDPASSRLRDFTDVGYKSGELPIPDWPVGVRVTDFGAEPDDKVDDSQAFLDAIAACPPKHAVLVPEGRYILLEPLKVTKDHIVIRGEDMFGSVLFFPKNMIEIDPPTKRAEFLQFEGDTHQGVENLSFVFREQMKMGHWEFRGADAISFAKSVEDGWARDLYIKNADHGIQVSGKHISVLNILFDHWIGRPDIIGSSGNSRWVGHVGIGMTSRKSLFHNIGFTGKYFHDFDIINVPTHNVVSNVKGFNMALHHHGQGANHNLYTHVDAGKGTRALGGLKDSQRQRNETHWGIFGEQPLNTDMVPLETKNGHVFVGFDAALPTTITDTLWFEKIDPENLQPQNIYLAQMAKAGKPLPGGSIPPRPPRNRGDLIRILPDEATKTQYTFDLSDLNLGEFHRARLRVHMARAVRPPFTYSAYPAEEEAWIRDWQGSGGGPSGSAKLDEFRILEKSSELPMEFDVTSYVQAKLEEDGVVSLKLEKSKTGTYNGFLGGTDRGNAPMLIIENVSDPVPGPPSPPTGLQTTARAGHILLDWDDNFESDVETYNVYRLENKPFGAHLTNPIATGLIYSEFADVTYKENRSNCDLPPGETFHYVVTAVDEHGYESLPGEEVTGSALDPDRPERKEKIRLP